MALGQLQRLPPELASNPFYPLLVKFSRLKMGSLEWLFTVEGFLLRHAWVALFILFALVLPPLEEVDLLSTLVRLTTLIYPCFFIWSLTRLSGVELIQCMIEGQWLADLLAAPIDNDDLIHGFATPLWIIIRQYALMSVFSLVLYALETRVVVVEGQFFVWELARPLILYLGVFFSAVAWIACVYMARLTIEARVRGGLLKGIATLCFLLTGMLILASYGGVFIFHPTQLSRPPMLIVPSLLTALLALVALWLYSLLRRNFRGYLAAQLEFKWTIADHAGPSPWKEPGEDAETAPR